MKKKKWIVSVVCIVFALLSFFVLAKIFTSPQIYTGVFKTLESLQKRAIELTSMSTILATGAAAIPGETMTPIANKLADMSGYLVIIYVVIILEKYLVTLAAYKFTNINNSISSKSVPN